MDELQIPQGPRLWLFRLLSVTAVPAVLLALVLGITESTLRWMDVGFEPAFLVHPSQVHPSHVGDGSKAAGSVADGHPRGDRWVTNRRFGWRFFPREIARGPVPLALGAKEEGALRIAVVGGSAAQGVPESAFGLARQLQAMFELTHPGERVEVINAAMTAINSHVVRAIVGDLMDHDLDAVVVYMGNNEVVGPYGAGSVFGTFHRRLTWIRAGIALRSTRLGQLLDQSLRPRPGAVSGGEWRGMEMFLDQRVTADDPALDAVYRHFEQNLEAIVDRVEGAGATVVLSTVASNLVDQPPFASEDGPKGADASYALGLELLEADRVLQALEAFERARDLDTLRFRADSRINAGVRRVAEARGLRWVDAEQQLRPDRTHFYEHVHLNPSGNHALASLFFAEVQAALGLEVRPAPSLEAVSDQLAFSPFDAVTMERAMVRLIERPPFAGQERHGELVATARQRLQLLESTLDSVPTAWQDTHDAYARRLETHPDDLEARRRFAELLVDRGQGAEAIPHWQHLVDRVPGVLAWHDALASSLASAGRVDEGLAELDRAEALAPEAAGRISINRGDLLERAGRLDAAAECYRRAAEARPFDPVPRYNAIHLVIQAGDLPRATAELRRLVEDFPQFVAGHHNLGVALARQGQPEEAIVSYRRALELDPTRVSAHNGLGLALEAVGLGDDAEQAYREALAIEPRSTLPRFNLADLLLTTGRAAEAVEHYRAGLALAPDNIQARRNLSIAEGHLADKPAESPWIESPESL